MKIVDVEAIHLRVDDPNIGLFDGSYDDCLIVIRTDSGLTGIGECESYSPAVVAMVNGPSSHNHAMCLKEILVGEKLDDPVRLWHKAYEATDYVGRRGIAMHALGGIDLALWDLHGQAESKPIFDLLGGARRKRLRAYGTIYPIAQTPDEVGQQIRDVQAMNLRAFKLVADPWWLDDLTRTQKLLQAARSEAGSEAMIIVDAALAYRTVEEGMKLVPLLEEIGIDFLEAPLPLDDVAGHAEMSKHGLPLGVGDLGLTHVNEFIEMMERGGASICQPDISMVGGFTGIGKIAEAAIARGKRVITHGYKTNIIIAANLHFLANHQNDEILEYSTSKSPLRWKTTQQSISVEDDGKVTVPDQPGLGVTLDWDFVNAHRFQGR